MKLLSYLLLTIILSSCAAWRSGETRTIGTFPNSIKLEGKLPKVSIVLKRFEILENSVLDKEETNRDNEKEVNALVEKAYKDAKIFDIVDEDSPNKDMSIEIEVTRNHIGSSGMKYATALTLYLFPRKAIERITITTRFLDKKGELAGMVEKVEDAITWHQFFMVFAFPFSSTPNNVATEAIIDLNRATIIDAFQDGYFVDIND